MSLRAILRKDMMRESRSRSAIQAGLVVALLLLVVDLFAFSIDAVTPLVAAAILWTPLAYAGIAAAGRGIANEADAGTLDRLRMAGTEPVWTGLARTLTDVAATALVTAAATVAASLLFAIDVDAKLVVPLALGVAGVAVVGSLAGGLAAQARGRDILLPLLAVPLLAPLVQAGVSATASAIEGAALADMAPRLWAMAGYDVAALAGAWLLWPHLLEADA